MLCATRRQLVTYQLQQKLAFLLRDIGNCILLLVSCQLIAAAENFGNEGANAVDEGGGGVFRNEFALAKQQYLLSNGLHIADHMGGEQYDFIRCQGGNIVSDADALFRVKTGSRLVQKKDLGIAQQRLGQKNALAHAAGEAAHFLVQTIGKAHHLQTRGVFNYSQRILLAATRR